MRTIKVVTNESFEKYIDFLNRKEKYESLHRGRKFEDRWDTLDLDDITSDVKAPSDSEVNAAVCELDLFDDVAIKAGAGDVEVGAGGKLRLLDLDDEPAKKSKSDKGDDRVRSLDLDDEPKGSRRSKKIDDADDVPAIGDLDYDEKGADVKKKKSNVGAIGALDYDDDIDTSKVAASIEDVYTCLAGSDVKVVKGMIKRYAADITDENKIKEVMLVHATNLNLECLRVVCGDMKVTLTAKEKELGFIDRDDIKEALNRLKKIAHKLTGENNTYGLIPNAIVACTPDKQTQCVNVIDFLKVWCDLPVFPIYFRGAMIRHNYDLAKYLFEELEHKLPIDILTGAKGLLNRMKQLDDIPAGLMNDIVDAIASNKQLNFSMLGDLAISLLRSDNKKAVKSLLSGVSENKENMIRDYVDDEDAASSEKLSKIKITRKK